MYIDEKTGTTLHANLDESVIYGTIRYCDLIPAFLDVIRDTPEYPQLLLANVPPSISLDDKDNEWWDSEDAFWFYMAVHDILESYAPEGLLFRCPSR